MKAHPIYPLFSDPNEISLIVVDDREYCVQKQRDNMNNQYFVIGLRNIRDVGVGEYWVSGDKTFTGKRRTVEIPVMEDVKFAIIQEPCDATPHFEVKRIHLKRVFRDLWMRTE